jgi:glutamate-1-semialdehyde 2,1-aminomutase
MRRGAPRVPPPAPAPMSPSDYMDARTATLALAVSLLILNPPKISLRLLGSGAAVLGALRVAAEYGVEADATVVVATLVGVRAAYRAYQLVLTLLATFPLTITFPWVVDLLPRFSIEKKDFFRADGATEKVAAQRKAALEALQAKWAKKYPGCLKFATSLKTLISDVRFTSGRCFPPFNKVTNDYLDPSMALARTEGSSVVDIDNNSALDISGSYGVNVCGYEAYKQFISKGWESAKDKGLYLGSLDETTLENIQMIQKVSGLDEVSFHMSGTEAVMAAVRCARFNKRRPLVVTFGGAYHGWWDGMQPAAGNERTPGDVLCLKDMNSLSLAVIKARSSEIAAVLVNPLQCFHLNASPPSDVSLRPSPPISGHLRPSPARFEARAPPFVPALSTASFGARAPPFAPSLHRNGGRAPAA